MKISILIPAYNEEKTVGQVIKKVSSIKLPRGVSREIIVINDGSTDKTVQKVRETKVPLKLIKHVQNQGKGAAIRSGIEASSGEVIIIQDADLEYNPDDISRLLTPLQDAHITAVYGSRLVDYPLRLWGTQETAMPLHWLANHLLSLLTRILYGQPLTDMETGYKAIRADIIKSFKLSANRFDIEPEITAKLLKSGHKIVEIPIQVTLRDYSQGKKIGWKDGVIAVKTLIKERFI